MITRRLLVRVLASMLGGTAAIAIYRNGEALTCYPVTRDTECTPNGEYMMLKCLWCRGSSGGGFWIDCHWEPYGYC